MPSTSEGNTDCPQDFSINCSHVAQRVVVTSGKCILFVKQALVKRSKEAIAGGGIGGFSEQAQLQVNEKMSQTLCEQTR